MEPRPVTRQEETFIGLMVQPIKSSSNKYDFNSVKLNS